MSNEITCRLSHNALLLARDSITEVLDKESMYGCWLEDKEREELHKARAELNNALSS